MPDHPEATAITVPCCWHGDHGRDDRWTARETCFLHHRLRDGDRWVAHVMHAGPERSVCDICGRTHCMSARHAERRVQLGLPVRLSVPVCAMHTTCAAVTCRCAMARATQTWTAGRDYGEYEPLDERWGTADLGSVAMVLPCGSALPPTSPVGTPALVPGPPPAAGSTPSASLAPLDASYDALDDAAPVEPSWAGPSPADVVYQLRLPPHGALRVSHSPWALGAVEGCEQRTGFQLPAIATGAGLALPDTLGVVTVARPQLMAKPHWPPGGGAITVSPLGYRAYRASTRTLGTGLLRSPLSGTAQCDPEIVLARWNGTSTPPGVNELVGQTVVGLRNGRHCRRHHYRRCPAGRPA